MNCGQNQQQKCFKDKEQNVLKKGYIYLQALNFKGNCQKSCSHKASKQRNDPFMEDFTTVTLYIYCFHSTVRNRTRPSQLREIRNDISKGTRSIGFIVMSIYVSGTAFSYILYMTKHFLKKGYLSSQTLHRFPVILTYCKLLKSFSIF